MLVWLYLLILNQLLRVVSACCESWPLENDYLFDWFFNIFSHACICLYTQNLHDYVRRYVYINKKSICIYICLIMFVFIERHFAWRWIRYPSLFSLWRLNSTKGAATVEHFAGGTDKKRSLVVSPSFFCVMIICCHKMCHRWIIYCIFLCIYILI